MQWLRRLTLCAAVSWAYEGAGNIVTPSAAQFRYQSTDFVALIHFNMATFAHNGDPGCDKGNWNVKAPYATGPTRDPATFNPKLLNTTQWFDSILALGAKIAVLTAKHGCGFTLWPTEAKLPDGSSYGYGVKVPGAAVQHDVLRDFVDSAQASGVGHGFYFSIMKNFYLCRNFHGKNSCMKEVLPGQHNLTDKEYLQVARQQATELWTQYGDLAEVMTDSGLGDLADLMVQLQPQAVGTPHNPFAWCGTESGHPSHDVGPGDIWNPGNGHFGSPKGTSWFAKYCDPVLFQEHIWFWEPNLHVRTLAMLIPIYHDIVGRGMVMELDFAIDRDGLVEDSHAKAYKELGDWVRSCYGTPLVMASGTGGELTLGLRAGHVFDRFMIEEDIIMGQRVRNYTIESSVDGTSWASLAGAEAIGRKRIHLLKTPITATDGLQVRLRISQAIATPQLKFFGVFSPCGNGTTSIAGSTPLVI